MKKPPLLVIAGPTAVGKSKLALCLAKEIGGEIISADSAQIYKGMDIGTDKPTRQEQAIVPHHMLDVVYPDRVFTVADYQRLAKKAILAVWQRKRMPILVGGTGLYIKAVIDNYAFNPSREDPKIRQDLMEEAKKEGVDLLYKRLGEVDPETAARTHPNNLRRVIRGLEYYYRTGEPISSQYRRTRSSSSLYHAVMFVLHRPRPELYRRIEQRVDHMLAAGLVDEVRNLLKKGYHRGLKSMQILGYRQVAAYLDGEVNFSRAVAEIKRDTRRYAKRQLTWFRGDSRYRWLDLAEMRQEEAGEKIISFMQEYLSGRRNKRFEPHL